MSGRYKIIRECKVAEVLRHFICMEADRPKYADMRHKMLGWLKLSDRRLIRKVRKFEKTRDDDNPTLGWTIGTRANSNYRGVSHWVLASISLADLYTCGINPKMKGDLDSVNGNLKRFVDAGYATKYPEFRLDSIPSEGKARTLIGIARSESNRDGNIELIDGAHRVVPMLANGIMSSDAYIGELHG